MATAVASTSVILAVRSPGMVVTVVGFVVVIGSLAYFAYRVSRSWTFGALLALIGVIAIPDLVGGAALAWQGADQDFARYRSDILAGSTGAVRTIVGLLWPLFIAFVWATNPKTTVALHKSDGSTLWFVLLTALYMFSIYLKSCLSILDAVILLLLLAAFVWSLSRQRPNVRSTSVTGTTASPNLAISAVLVALAVGAIAASSYWFVTNLAEIVHSLGLNSVKTVQWLFSLGSKTPILIIVWMMVRRGWSDQVKTGLLSGHFVLLAVTLAAIPLVYLVRSTALGEAESLPLDDRQRTELLLAAAQSVFLVVLLARMVATLRTAIMLFGLFLLQLVLSAVQPGGQVTLTQTLLAGGYIGGSLLIMLADRARLQVMLDALPTQGISLLGRRKQ